MRHRRHRCALRTRPAEPRVAGAVDGARYSRLRGTLSTQRFVACGRSLTVISRSMVTWKWLAVERMTVSQRPWIVSLARMTRFTCQPWALAWAGSRGSTVHSAANCRSITVSWLARNATFTRTSLVTRPVRTSVRTSHFGGWTAMACGDGLAVDGAKAGGVAPPWRG